MIDYYSNSDRNNMKSLVVHWKFSNLLFTSFLFVIEIQYIQMLMHSRYYFNNYLHKYMKSFPLSLSKSSKRIKVKDYTTSISSEESKEYTLEVTMDQVKKSISKSQNEIINGLKTNGWIVIDNFLNTDLCNIMRKEAVYLYENNYFSLSQSTRWDAKSQSAIPYDKHNVFSTQLQGGNQYYIAPRLHEYMVGMTKMIEPILSSNFPEAQLSDTMMSNKLAVCTGNGSAYDKHYDNSGMDDTRKVTILYYMNHQWRPECGGCFRIYKSSVDPNSNEDVTIDIEPLANRLLMFWSDRLVHSVLPSEAPRGAEDHRYALTLWLTSVTPDAIIRDDSEIIKHFGDLT